MQTDNERFYSVFAKPAIDAVILVGLACYLAWLLWNKRAPGSPPGTRGIPLIGAVTSLRAHPERVMAKWTQKYGAVCMVKMGLKDVVVIGSAEAAHEAYVKSTSFGDRPQPIEVFAGDFGILMIKSGDFHLEQRRFGLGALREFGMGKRSLEPRLVEIADALCEKLDGLCLQDGRSQPFKIDTMVYDAISNVISQMVFGYQVSNEKAGFRRLLHKMVEPNKLHVLIGAMLVAPFLRVLPFFRSVVSDSARFRDDLNDLIEVEIEDHVRTRHPGEPRDFIDCFLDEIERSGRESPSTVGQETEDTDDDLKDCKNNPSASWKRNSSFTRRQLSSYVRDLFMASTDTTATAITWLILYLCRDQEVQRRVQEELDDVFGQSGFVTMRLQDKLPYFRAVIQETLRIRPPVPLSVPHQASRSDTLMGFTIPKGAMFLTNIFGIHHDEKLWPEPEVFRPERHLDASGAFVKSSNVMMFSVGSRSCLGQQLAKMQLFTVVASLFRRFDFSLAPGQDNMDMRGMSMVNLRPPTFDLIVKNRS